MRIRTGLAFGLLLISLGLAACGGEETPAGTPSAPVEADPVAFAQCMRDHGIEMDDPGEGKFGMKLPDGTDPVAAEAAMQACKHLLPNGGEPPEADPEAQEKAYEYAECMRENGIGEFPDPDPNGGGSRLPDGIDPQDPAFQAAEQACAEFMPEGTEKKEGP